MEIKGLGHLVCNKKDINFYVSKIEQYYRDYETTTEIQVDSLVLIYKLTGDDRIFSLLFKCHEFLLRKIVSSAYQKWKRHLKSEEDLNIVEERITNPDAVRLCLSPKCQNYDKHKTTRKIRIHRCRCGKSW